MSTQEILDRLKAACEAATDGPWEYDKYTVFYNTHDEAPFAMPTNCMDDGEFIALSRTALPALVEALERVFNIVPGHWVTDEVNAHISNALAPLKEQLP